jgi:hypothetical protein
VAAKTYLIQNSAMVASGSSAAKQPTGAGSARTMMQVVAATGFPMRVIEWGCSFDASAAATPGQVELLDCYTTFATMSTAYGTSDVQPFSDPNAPANTSGTAGFPFNLGTAFSGFATTTVAENSSTTTRMFDLQLISPTGQYVKQFPLGREPEIPAGHGIRVRMNFGTSVNAYTYVIMEI